MRLAMLLALALSTTACGDDDGDGSSYIAVDDMPAAYKEAYCTFLARCGVFPDTATCVGATLVVVPTLDQNVIAAVHAGRVIYNGNNVRTCFDAVANDTCDQTDENGRTRTTACGLYFQGTVAAGGECFIDQECVSQQCSGGTTDTVCSRGTCVGDTAPVFEPLAVGMPCASNGACIDGAYCDTVTNVCTELRASGASCTGSTECGYGLACAGTTGARTCQPLPALGETCRLDLPCRDEGQFCNTSTSVCTQVGVTGVACTTSQQCSPYYRCDTTAGACTKTPILGQSCAAVGRCFEAGTYCDSVTCVEAKPDGMPCMGDIECQSDNCDFNVAPATCTSPTVCI